MKKLIRVAAALSYDFIILTTLFFFFTAIVLIFTHGQAIAPKTRWFQAALAFIAGGYFYFSLRFGGQTVGMRAWHLKFARQSSI